MSSGRSRVRYRGAPAVARAIRQHARDEHPRECCGFLLGDGREILFAVPMTNVAASPATRYRIDDSAHVSLRRWLRQVRPRLTITGVYHSHPGGEPAPSPTDVREAHYPDWVYVIAGGEGRRIRLQAYRIAGGAARLVQVVWKKRS